MKQILGSIAQLEQLLAQLPLNGAEHQQATTLLDKLKSDLAVHQQRIECITTEYEFYRASLDALPNPIFIKNDRGEFVYFNPKYQAYFDMDPAIYLHKTVLDLSYLPMEERQRYQAEDLELIRTGDVRHYEASFELTGGEVGHSLYWSKGFSVASGQTKGLVGEIVDISLQKKLQAEIAQGICNLEVANQRIECLIRQDCLTGLYNRRVLDDLIAEMSHQSDNGQISASMIMADLDLFKRVNDTYGHAVGDEVLVRFSKILQNCCREEDLLVRYGGEEFLLVFFNTSRQVAAQVAERIRLRTEEELTLPDGSSVTVSLGVTRVLPGETFFASLTRADVALYHAKKKGRNRVMLGWVEKFYL